MFKSLDEFSKEKSYKESPNLFIEKLRCNGFDDNEILSIINVVDNICPYCYNNNSHCQCMNDE